MLMLTLFLLLRHSRWRNAGMTPAYSSVSTGVALKNKNPISSKETGFSVEMQGFEPWSRQGSQRAFYVRIYAWIFEEFQAHIRPLKLP